MKPLEIVNPSGWLAPRGYANGVLGEGRLLLIAGQIGWDEQCKIVGNDFALQFDQALKNVVAVLSAANVGVESVARMTVYVTDLGAYRGASKQLGSIWKKYFGRHYPAMSLIGVAGLLEPGALVEIEATAIIPLSKD